MKARAGPLHIEKILDKLRECSQCEFAGNHASSAHIEDENHTDTKPKSHEGPETLSCGLHQHVLTHQSLVESFKLTVATRFERKPL